MPTQPTAKIKVDFVEEVDYKMEIDTGEETKFPKETVILQDK